MSMLILSDRSHIGGYLFLQCQGDGRWEDGAGAGAGDWRLARVAGTR